MLTLREDVGHIFGAGKAAEHRLTFAGQMKPRTRGLFGGFFDSDLLASLIILSLGFA